ncbi:MAG: RluA family pseudouridine synthase [Tannerellaceae bacterium]|jgi:23S rRNA pseudouridine1911/1915/1917 synthase|nr:RluA family pseudouridine synthase [Tannerellaceae bacterium]
MEIVYEDNHLIAVNKNCHEIVQGDKTGDTPLSETIKLWLKEKYQKPGNVFLGVTHRLDRPVTGIVLFAKTSKSLARMNELFRHGEIQKTYLAIVKNRPPHDVATLTHWLTRNEQQNKSYAHPNEVAGSQKSILHYRLKSQSERYFLLEIKLETGRHHQIRAQLAYIKCPIKGDLKYGAERSNPDGGISLHALSAAFIHPVSKHPVHVFAPPPPDRLWLELIKEAGILPTE